MMSNIVSTAAGVGIGHVIGQGLTGLFGGGSATSAEPAAAATGTTQDTRGVVGCDADAKAFTKCMDDYKGDMTTCSWYLDQLKVMSSFCWDVDGVVLSADGEAVLGLRREVHFISSQHLWKE
jgi:hypothetical protein